MTLQSYLTGLAIPVPDVQTITAAYPNIPEHEFIAGAEMLARIINGIEKPQRLPAAPFDDPVKQMLGITDAQRINDIFSAWVGGISPPALSLALLSVIMAAARKPTQPKNTKAALPDMIQQVIDNQGKKMRKNECTATIEINGKPMNDDDLSLIVNELQRAGIKTTDSRVLHAIRETAHYNGYHPVKEYLATSTWDGKPHIANLAAHFLDKDGLFPLLLRKWLIGSVSKVYNQTFNPILILDGAQGLGKSFFVKWLTPKNLRAYYVEGAINPENEDCQRRLFETWIWEVSEFGNTTRRADREALKAFLSTETVKIRRKYDRYDTQRPAMANFIGTVNAESGLYNDPTGTRRFWTVTLLSIDRAYSKINPDDIWAEAYAAWLSGENNLLPDDNQAQIVEINESYQEDNPVMEMILECYTFDVNDTNAWVSSHDILMTLQEKYKLSGNLSHHSKAIAACMTKLGAKRIKRRRNQATAIPIWGYQGLTEIPNFQVI